MIGPHKPAPGPFDLRLWLGKYFRLRDGIGPLQTTPGPFDTRLRLGKYFRLREGIGPCKPHLAHSIYASGLVNIFDYATELAPTNPPLAFAVTRPGWLEYALTRISNTRPGGFLFYGVRPFVGADGFGYVV